MPIAFAGGPRQQTQADGAMKALAKRADFSLLPDALGADVRRAIQEGLRDGVLSPKAHGALEFFRRLVGESIQDIEGHPRGVLLQRFLREGPYEDRGRIPRALRAQRLKDDETAQAISFIHSFMINAFQGRLAEALAVLPCCRIIRNMQREGMLGADARAYFGESVLVGQSQRPGRYKGADLHVLAVHGSKAEFFGVGEIKSYHASPVKLAAQLKKHVVRVRRGIMIEGTPFAADAIGESRSRPFTIIVSPSAWRLPRSFRFVRKDGSGTFLNVDPAMPPEREDRIVRTGPRSWRVTLRWSREALAAAAYEMTFWYMAGVGEVVYRESSPWPEMTPQEAGRNAAKQMLYFSILRATTPHQFQRAVALYNVYGFGYALGTSFKDRNGGRAMLWPEDLHEILKTGSTKHGARLVP
jgi:hypothetical protein